MADPPCSVTFWDWAVGCLVREVSLSPGSGYSHLKVSAWSHPPRGHAGSRALPHCRLTEAAEQSKEKPHVVTFWRMSLSMSTLIATVFRSTRPVQTKGGQVIEDICPSYSILHPFFFPALCVLFEAVGLQLRFWRVLLIDLWTVVASESIQYNERKRQVSKTSEIH